MLQAAFYMQPEPPFCRRTGYSDRYCSGRVLGLLAGYFGGLADILIMRFTDMVMSFPYILLVLVAAAIFKPGLWSIILILGFVDWPGIARLVRGNVLSLRETNFVKSSEAAGMPAFHILFSEILPNTMAPVLVYATSVMALTMLDEAALSFLGMGVQPPAASLGNMLNSAQSVTVLTKQPWLWIPPGLVIIIVVTAVNFVGDALRDAFDPLSIIKCNRRYAGRAKNSKKSCIKIETECVKKMSKLKRRKGKTNKNCMIIL